MNIVNQSFKILPEIENKVNQIGSRSRVCYLSEPASSGDESGFVNGIIKAGHNSCLEMAAITLCIENGDHEYLQFDVIQYKYLTKTYVGETLLLTGTIRAFREIFLRLVLNDNGIMDACAEFLYNKFYFFFKDVINIKSVRGHDEINISLYDWDLNPNKYNKETKRHHQWVAVRFNTNRAVTHEIVRHRPVTYLQESQRYCNYSKGKFGRQVTYINPTAFNFSETYFLVWKAACTQAEITYFYLLDKGYSAEVARIVLPNSCRTHLIVYCSLKQWEHIFAMRTNKHCDPSMQEAIYPVLEEFKKLYPRMFDDCQRTIG